MRDITCLPSCWVQPVFYLRSSHYYSSNCLAICQWERLGVRLYNSRGERGVITSEAEVEIAPVGPVRREGGMNAGDGNYKVTHIKHENVTLCGFVSLFIFKCLIQFKTSRLKNVMWCWIVKWIYLCRLGWYTLFLMCRQCTRIKKSVCSFLKYFLEAIRRLQTPSLVSRQSCIPKHGRSVKQWVHTYLWGHGWWIIWVKILIASGFFHTNEESNETNLSSRLMINHIILCLKAFVFCQRNRYSFDAEPPFMQSFFL